MIPRSPRGQTPDPAIFLGGRRGGQSQCVSGATGVRGPRDVAVCRGRGRWTFASASVQDGRAVLGRPVGRAGAALLLLELRGLAEVLRRAGVVAAVRERDVRTVVGVPGIPAER